MIWSLDRTQVTAAVSQMERAGMLQLTEFQKQLGSTGLHDVAVKYLELPRSAEASGRIVVPIAHLLSGGQLDTQTPYAYGVIASTLAKEDRLADNEVAAKNSKEAHVLTEHLAFRNGIFTPYGRLVAEKQVIDNLPFVQRHQHAQLRIAHLDALLGMLRKELTLAQPKISSISKELALARLMLIEEYIQA